jgi:hypothetical protein
LENSLDGSDRGPVIINLTHIGRLDLLGKLPPYSFVVPEEVVKEVRESKTEK